MALGLIVVLVETFPLVKRCKAKKKIEMLMQTGKRLQATIDKITINEYIAVNDMPSYIIRCSYVDEYSGNNEC